MKKVLFAAFAGICIVSSIMATSVNPASVTKSQRIEKALMDTVPGKKTDTSSWPKKDTSSMPKFAEGIVK